MSVKTADSSFKFHLPSLSYIDAKWEEPNLRAPAPQSERSTGLAAWLSRGIAALIAWRRERIAAAELARMSDRELADIGLTWSDRSRAFEAAFNQDLRRRGTAD